MNTETSKENLNEEARALAGKATPAEDRRADDPLRYFPDNHWELSAATPAEATPETDGQVCGIKHPQNPQYVKADFARTLERRLAAALARVAELEAQTAWRPIESAPKDGTPIVVRVRNEFPASEDSPEFLAVQARWETFDNVMSETLTGWLRQDEDALCYPDHWMPLPAAPKNGGAL